MTWWNVSWADVCPRRSPAKYLSPTFLRTHGSSHCGCFRSCGGLLCHPSGIYARYTVYEKNAQGLRLCEFAFSPDNLRPLGTGPWVTLQEADPEAELLADLTRVLRTDENFWEPFDRRVDALQERFGICCRGEDGFFRFPADGKAPLTPAVMKSTVLLWRQMEEEGHTERAVQALCRAGYLAWKNPVGDIAVLPAKGSLAALSSDA